MLNAITVDIEDYFHSDAISPVVPREFWEQMPSRVEQNTEKLLEIFARLNVRATFFVLGWVAERHPNLVSLVHELGHELGCHSYWHRPTNWLSAEQFREDTYRARSEIENAAGAPVYGYRAPHFSITPQVDWAFEVLADLGFTYDSSVNPVDRRAYPDPDAWRLPYTVAGGALLEIPVTTWRVGQTILPVGSGACLRVLPYSYLAGGIRRMNQEECTPAILHLEPSDFDPGQPRLPIRGLKRFRQYAGLARTDQRLERLLGEFRMGPLGQAFDPHFATLGELVV